MLSLALLAQSKVGNPNVADLPWPAPTFVKRSLAMTPVASATLGLVFLGLGFAGTFAAHGYLAVDFFFLLSGVVKLVTLRPTAMK